MAVQYTGAGTKISYKAVIGSETGVEILGVSDVTLPDQSYNTIDLEYLADDMGVKQRKKGDINGGQLTFNINPKAEQATVLAGLKAAYLDAVNDYEFTVTLKNGATYKYQGAVTTMTKGQLTKTGLMTYAVTVEVNTLEVATEATGA